MNRPQRLDLSTPRHLGALLGEAVGVYVRHFGVFIAIAAAVVVPVQLIVSGIGLEQLTSGFRGDPDAAEMVIPTLVSFLVVAPLITATAIHALHALADGRAPRVGESLQAGLDVFAPLFLAIAMAALGIVLGLFALIVPGIYLAVRWFYVPQAVMIEGARGLEALTRSGKVVNGFWWRTLGVVLLGNLAAALPGILIISPLRAAAESADRQAIALAGDIAVQTLTAPFLAVLATLLYYDLRARRAEFGADRL